MQKEITMKVETIVEKYISAAKEARGDYFKLSEDGISVDYRDLAFDKQLIAHIFNKNEIFPFTQLDVSGYIEGILSDEEELYLKAHFDELWESLNKDGDLLSISHGFEFFLNPQATPFADLLANNIYKVLAFGKQSLMVAECYPDNSYTIGFDKVDEYEWACLWAQAHPKIKVELLCFDGAAMIDEIEVSDFLTIAQGHYDIVLYDIRGMGQFVSVLLGDEDKSLSDILSLVRESGRLFIYSYITDIFSNLIAFRKIVTDNKYLISLGVMCGNDWELGISFCCVGRTPQTSFNVYIERTANDVCQKSFPMDMLILDCWDPHYYLNRETSDISLSDICTEIGEFIPFEERKSQIPCVFLDNMSNDFGHSLIKKDDLRLPQNGTITLLKEVSEPCVIIEVTLCSFAIGYYEGDETIYVHPDMICLKAKEGYSAKYIAAELCSQRTHMQMKSLREIFRNQACTNGWVNIFVPKREIIERAEFVSMQMGKALNKLNLENKTSYHKYRESVRMRKHALMQTVRALQARFNSVDRFLKKNDGIIRYTDNLSVLHPITAAENFEGINSLLQKIGNQVDHLADENTGFGKPEPINLLDFLNKYMKENTSPIFNFKRGWEKCRDAESKKEIPNLICVMPPKALETVLNNIVRNAIEHGFVDSARTDYHIEFNLYSLNALCILDIKNNGAPLKEGMREDEVLTFGYSSQLNHNGHMGLGGSEIDSIMGKYNGKAKFRSLHGDNTIGYRLIFTLTNEYTQIRL